MILPRFLRLRDAPSYLGMDVNKFNQMVRPHLTQVRLGKQALAFDRHELDDWADEYKARNGRPAVQIIGEHQLWDVKGRQAFVEKAKSGTSTSDSAESRFEKALAQATSKKRS